MYTTPIKLISNILAFSLVGLFLGEILAGQVADIVVSATVPVRKSITISTVGSSAANFAYMPATGRKIGEIAVISNQKQGVQLMLKDPSDSFLIMTDATGKIRKIPYTISFVPVGEMPVGIEAPEHLSNLTPTKEGIPLYWDAKEKTGGSTRFQYDIQINIDPSIRLTEGYFLTNLSIGMQDS